jgi:hypothetical protein
MTTDLTPSCFPQVVHTPQALAIPLFLALEAGPDYIPASEELAIMAMIRRIGSLEQALAPETLDLAALGLFSETDLAMIRERGMLSKVELTPLLVVLMSGGLKEHHALLDTLVQKNILLGPNPDFTHGARWLDQGTPPANPNHNNHNHHLLPDSWRRLSSIHEGMVYHRRTNLGKGQTGPVTLWKFLSTCLWNRTFDPGEEAAMMRGRILSLLLDLGLPMDGQDPFVGQIARSATAHPGNMVPFIHPAPLVHRPEAIKAISRLLQDSPEPNCSFSPLVPAWQSAVEQLHLAKTVPPAKRSRSKTATPSGQGRKKRL